MAADLSLYQTGEVDSAVQEIDAQRIANYQDPKQEQIALDLVGIAEYYPLPQALPTFETMLSSSSIFLKIAAAKAIGGLGALGTKDLPLLEKELGEMKATRADYRAILEMQRAIDVIKLAGARVSISAPSNSLVKQLDSVMPPSGSTGTAQNNPGNVDQMANLQPSSLHALWAVIGFSASILVWLSYVFWRKSKQ